MNAETTKNYSVEHPSFSRIHAFIKGQLTTIETQLCSHHIMHCHRCEAIWEQLIRKTQSESARSPGFRWLLNLF